MKMDDEYIKREAGKPCYWLDDGTFDLVTWTNNMTQQASDRAGSKINTLKYDLDHARLEIDRLRKELSAMQKGGA